MSEKLIQDLKEFILTESVLICAKHGGWWEAYANQSDRTIMDFANRIQKEKE